jgi:hypothetical protein
VSEDTQPTPQEAEETLREAIAAYDDRPVGDDLHAADALVWAMQRRQWLSSAETEDLRAHLAGVLPRLRGYPHPRLAPSGGTDPGSRTVRKRPVAVTILLAHVANSVHAANSADTPLGGIIDALVAALTAPAGVNIDGERLRRALYALTIQPLHLERPEGDEDGDGGGRGEQPVAPQADVLERTIAAFRNQFARSAESAAHRLRESNDTSHSDDSEPAWVLWVLIDALRDSAWLTEDDLAGLRDEMFSHFGFDPPQPPPPPLTPPTDLDLTLRNQLTDTAARIARDTVEQVADLGDSEPRVAAHGLLDAIGRVARSYSVANGDLDEVVDRLRVAVDAVFHGEFHGERTPPDRDTRPPADAEYLFRPYTHAERESLTQDVVAALTTRLDSAADKTGLTDLLADAFEEIVEIFESDIDTENLRVAFTVRWPDFDLDHDRIGPGLSRADSTDSGDASEARAANPVVTGAASPIPGHDVFPDPLPAEQQEKAQAIVDALADRIRHAPATAGLMELAADALAEVAETFGAAIDVEHCRAALVRRWP